MGLSHDSITTSRTPLCKPSTRASCTAPTAVIKSLAEAFAALGFCGANKTESDEVGHQHQTVQIHSWTLTFFHVVVPRSINGSISQRPALRRLRTFKPLLLQLMLWTDASLYGLTSPATSLQQLTLLCGEQSKVSITSTQTEDAPGLSLTIPYPLPRLVCLPRSTEAKPPYSPSEMVFAHRVLAGRARGTYRFCNSPEGDNQRQIQVCSCFFRAWSTECCAWKGRNSSAT